MDSAHRHGSTPPPKVPAFAGMTPVWGKAPAVAGMTPVWGKASAFAGMTPVWGDGARDKRCGMLSFVQNQPLPPLAIATPPTSVIPAKAGTCMDSARYRGSTPPPKVPAFAGMTPGRGKVPAFAGMTPVWLGGKHPPTKKRHPREGGDLHGQRAPPRPHAPPKASPAAPVPGAGTRTPVSIPRQDRAPVLGLSTHNPPGRAPAS
jgi:hypothetical protein